MTTAARLCISIEKMRKKPLPKTLRARVGAARPGGRSARVRSAVLAAAKAELVASGYDAFSVSRVARSARVQKTTIYRRWRTPQQLIMDVVLATAGEAIPIPDTGDLTSDLIRLIEQASVFLRSPAGRAFAIIGVQDGRELVAGQRGYWKRRLLASRSFLSVPLPADSGPRGATKTWSCACSPVPCGFVYSFLVRRSAGATLVLW